MSNQPALWTPGRNLHIEILLGRLNQKDELGGDVERKERDRNAYSILVESRLVVIYDFEGVRVVARLIWSTEYRCILIKEYSYTVNEWIKGRP
jgi:hypothetical protein